MVDFPKDSQKNIDSGEHRIVADLIDYLKQCRHRNVSSRALEMDVVKVRLYSFVNLVNTI